MWFDRTIFCGEKYGRVWFILRNNTIIVNRRRKRKKTLMLSDYTSIGKNETKCVKFHQKKRL
jgi:hypothetical protein